MNCSQLTYFEFDFEILKFRKYIKLTCIINSEKSFFSKINDELVLFFFNR